MLEDPGMTKTELTERQKRDQVLRQIRQVEAAARNAPNDAEIKQALARLKLQIC